MGRAEQHEVVVVGGGPAGVSTALFLVHARPDLCERVVVLEKERFPREKICAGAIGARADRMLASIGVRASVPEVVVTGMSAAFASGEVVAREGAVGRVVRRIELDAALAGEARRRGIRIVDGARATHIELRDGGAEITAGDRLLRARVVVGADGVGSVVRRAMGLSFGRLRAQVVEVDTEPTPSDPPRDLLHFDLRDRSYAGYSWDFPTLVDGRALVCRGTYVLSRGGTERAPDPERVLAARLAALGLDASRCTVKRFSERGFEPGVPMARPGALLVGEAAGIDPAFGEGIAQAIEYGALAGAFLAERIRRRGPVGVSDWGERVARSRLGRDLRLRVALVPRLFGRRRDALELAVAGEPALLRAAMRYFAGRSIPPAIALRAAGAMAAFAVRIGAEKLTSRLLEPTGRAAS